MQAALQEQAAIIGATLTPPDTLTRVSDFAIAPDEPSHIHIPRPSRRQASVDPAIQGSSSDGPGVRVVADRALSWQPRAAGAAAPAAYFNESA